MKACAERVSLALRVSSSAPNPSLERCNHAETSMVIGGSCVWRFCPYHPYTPPLRTGFPALAVQNRMLCTKESHPRFDEMCVDHFRLYSLHASSRAALSCVPVLRTPRSISFLPLIPTVVRKILREFRRGGGIPRESTFHQLPTAGIRLTNVKRSCIVGTG